VFQTRSPWCVVADVGVLPGARRDLDAGQLSSWERGGAWCRSPGGRLAPWPSGHRSSRSTGDRWAGSWLAREGVAPRGTVRWLLGTRPVQEATTLRAGNRPEGSPVGCAPPSGCGEPAAVKARTIFRPSRSATAEPQTYLAAGSLTLAVLYRMPPRTAPSLNAAGGLLRLPRNDPDV